VNPACKRLALKCLISRFCFYCEVTTYNDVIRFTQPEYFIVQRYSKLSGLRATRTGTT